jgi:hypothetical protein
MFLVRSAFWLTLVFSAMPFERSEIARAVDRAPDRLSADAVLTAKAECAGRAAACDALVAPLIAASRTAGLATATSSAPLRVAAARDGAKEAVRPSSNSLTSEDRSAPWRGRKAKPGA